MEERVERLDSIDAERRKEMHVRMARIPWRLYKEGKDDAINHPVGALFAVMTEALGTVIEATTPCPLCGKGLAYVEDDNIVSYLGEGQSPLLYFECEDCLGAGEGFFFSTFEHTLFRSDTGEVVYRYGQSRLAACYARGVKLIVRAREYQE